MTERVQIVRTIADAVAGLADKGVDPDKAMKHLIASVSVGVVKGRAVLDLDYAEDSRADTDMNVVMIESGGFIEVQGTAEGAPFDELELEQMLEYARRGSAALFEIQRAALEGSI